MFYLFPSYCVWLNLRKDKKKEKIYSYEKKERRRKEAVAAGWNGLEPMGVFRLYLALDSGPQYLGCQVGSNSCFAHNSSLWNLLLFSVYLSLFHYDMILMIILV